GDAGHGAAGHEHHVAAGQGDLAGQARTLVPDRVLGDLDEHRVAALERELDAARLALEAHGVPVDLAGVEHRVAAPADVHEGRLHRRQHVLDLPQVDVADHGGLRLLGDVVLDEHVVLEHGDLGAAGPLAHHHGALDGLAAGAAPPPTPPRAGGAGGGVAAGVRAVPARAGLGIVLRGLAVRLVVAVGAVVLTAAPTATATASATAPAPRSAVAGGAALAAAVVAGPVPVVAVVAVVPALRGGALAGVLGDALVALRGAARTAPAAARAGAALLLRGVLVLRAVGVLGAGVVGAVLVGDRGAGLRGRGLEQERGEVHLDLLATARAVLVLR